ncbi:MAG: histidinol-phosphate transaminase [Alphaproteobacteria bacterium RIFCSPLOWO2_01_FULL_40_26]|nr:MAG: histidinol-phosphate transaminase [Alphaproteobacteria bacterium RIFCSPHIGHO2_02_FULL_40_34]OFW94519.1 MAG: histidinol-phosphate transaminase [Alphaproteobacteria bacterium RIFCSPLOWO2_01_FULL_40_26]OFX10227.1 MAG: histidinol-phosphate transaminase [Alphaproteobacteria bacterium RIFCSPLOWO2_02_FULL_40_19]
MNLLAHSYLSSIKNYIPGKAAIDGRKAIKLSSNENALGASPKAIEAYKNHAAEIFRYADGSCLELREAIAEKNRIDADRIVCGAGSDEIIALLTSAFAFVDDEIIYSEHGFLMYPISAQRVGARPVKVAEKNLKADVDAIIAAITDKTKIIFIANPNNPTGSYLTSFELQQLIDHTPKNILIVLDYAYAEFVEKSDYPNAIELVDRYENVVMTRTFSKIYGLASLRIGWSYSSKYVAEILNKIRGPFNVGGPAQFAAIAALQDDEFFLRSKNHNKKWLEIFFAELLKQQKIKTHPSIANFILLDFGSIDECRKENQQLLAHNIIFREMGAYDLPHCLRMTIGTKEENLKILEILKEIR